MFYNNPDFWGPAEVQSFLSSVPNASMLILDLFSDSQPVWDKFDSYCEYEGPLLSAYQRDKPGWKYSSPRFAECWACRPTNYNS